METTMSNVTATAAEDITISYDWQTDWNDLTAINVEGKTFYPYTGDKITPKLAAVRKNNKFIKWNDNMCQPAYHVTYTSNHLAVLAIR